MKCSSLLLPLVAAMVFCSEGVYIFFLFRRKTLIVSCFPIRRWSVLVRSIKWGVYPNMKYHISRPFYFIPYVSLYYIYFMLYTYILELS